MIHQEIRDRMRAKQVDPLGVRRDVLRVLVECQCEESLQVLFVTRVRHDADRASRQLVAFILQIDWQ